MKQRIHIQIDQSLLNEVDEVCDSLGVSRTEFILQALRQKLNNDIANFALEQAVSELRDANKVFENSINNTRLLLLAENKASTDALQLMIKELHKEHQQKSVQVLKEFIKQLTNSMEE